MDGFQQEGHFNTLACVEWEKNPCETLANRLSKDEDASYQYHPIQLPTPDNSELEAKMAVLARLYHLSWWIIVQKVNPFILKRKIVLKTLDKFKNGCISLALIYWKDKITQLLKWMDIDAETLWYGLVHS